MRHYTVTWVVEVDAETAEDAAREALAMQRDHGSRATVFDVRDEESGAETTIDLDGPW